LLSLKVPRLCSFVLLIISIIRWTIECGALPEWYRQGQTEVLGKKLSQCHLVLHQSP
jgi:hypothetical protein